MTGPRDASPAIPDENGRYPGCPLMNQLADVGAVAIVASYGEGHGTDYHSTRPTLRDVAWLRALADQLEAHARESGETEP